MAYFIQQLKFRNQVLFHFSWVCLLFAIAFLLLSQIYNTRVMNANAWYKPAKFALSICLYAGTMAWFTAYLSGFNLKLYNYAVVILLGFELIYIAIQAARGQLSHYNISTPTYALLYQMMALAATAISLYTAYITVLFFKGSFPELPVYYLWSIRMGLLLFVVFSLEGFVMGAKMSHTIGGADGGPGLPFLNWSKKFGDPRIAHFVGMHALQLLPLLSFYVFKNTRLTIAAGLLYGVLAISILAQALNGSTTFK